MKVGWNLDQGPPFCKISILLHNRLDSGFVSKIFCCLKMKSVENILAMTTLNVFCEVLAYYLSGGQGSDLARFF